MFLFSLTGVGSCTKVCQQEGELSAACATLCSALSLCATHCHSQDYGQVPHYLKQRKHEMAEAQAEYDRYVQESMRRGEMQQVTNEER